jgi:RNA polymerase sigma-70 factor (ECF subfamily)
MACALQLDSAVTNEGLPRMPRASREHEPHEVSDEKLMARYVGGDAAAFETLFARYEPRAYAFFLRRAGSAERAQDLYQELFLRIHRARDAYDPRRPFAPWLFQIAHRLLVDDLRRAYRSREVPLDPRDLRSSAASAESVENELRRILGSLTVEEGYVLVSSKVHGLDYRELAAQLGKSVDAVKKMASRSMQRLRALHGAGGAL